jgi:hypothetical protein
MVERLDKVVIAGRKSKSLQEETKIPQSDMLLMDSLGDYASEGFRPSERNAPDSSDSGSAYAIGFSKDAFAREYSTLTTVDQEKNTQVCQYIAAVKRLDEMGILKSVGKNL